MYVLWNYGSSLSNPDRFTFVQTQASLDVRSMIFATTALCTNGDLCINGNLWTMAFFFPYKDLKTMSSSARKSHDI